LRSFTARLKPRPSGLTIYEVLESTPQIMLRKGQ
jgi:hypothetical protein